MIPQNDNNEPFEDEALDLPAYRPAVHPATLTEEKLMAECRLSQTRRGGPGGQHRNKTESAIVITHQPSGVVGQAGERRSQHQNRSVAIQRLRVQLALAIRSEVTAHTAPSNLWQGRSHKGQLKINPNHTDFPAILAEALDFLAAENWDIEPAGVRLGITKSQLIKLLKQEPAAFQMLNRKRKEKGMPPLK